MAIKSAAMGFWPMNLMDIPKPVLLSTINVIGINVNSKIER